MPNEEIARRSRWMMRAMEWDDPRARYPNIFQEGMPRHILAFERVVGRLRLGDLVVVFYPASQRHPERAEKFLGISRVAGLRRAEQSGFGWIDLETAWRFSPPLSLDQQPRRVFLCCDPEWPGPEVELFGKVFDAAVAAGWKPHEDERGTVEAGSARVRTVEPAAALAEAAEGAEEGPGEAPGTLLVADPGPATEEEPAGDARMFAGVGYSGDMRDPRHATWLAVAELRGDRLRVARLEAKGRHGLQGYLRDPDRTLMNVEAIGLDFPFGLPLRFAEKILGGPFPEEGWWALAKRMERLTRPDYLVAVQEFRDAEGELKRLTDERSGAVSPLHRIEPDLGPMTYHGIRMIAEDRSRFAVRPFESAQGRLLLEVYPGGVVKRMQLSEEEQQPASRNRAILRRLAELPDLPVAIDPSKGRHCLASRDALEAVIAARCAARAVLGGEVDRSPQELAPEEGDKVRLEGWIYGLEEPA